MSDLTREDVERVAGWVAQARGLADGAAAFWGVAAEPARWVFALEDVWLTSEDVSGAVPRGGLWECAPDPALPVANTGITWHGRRWAMVGFLPLRPGTLLLHESWHAAVQPHLPVPDLDLPGDGTLATPDGRAWFRSELAAWANVLRTMPEPGPRRTLPRAGGELETAAEADARQATVLVTADAITDALAIREARLAATAPGEVERQRVLELSEGLAEYHAHALLGTSPAAVADAALARDPRESWVRSACYDIGPALGYVLDALRGGGWRRDLRQDTDLGGLIRSALGASLPVPRLDDALGRAGHEEHVALEAALAREAREHRDELERVLVRGSVLRFPRDGLVYDPRFATPMAGGTAYDAAWVTAEGLRVAAAPLLSGPGGLDVPCPERPAAGATDLAGPGWTATLAHPWEDAATWVER